MTGEIGQLALCLALALSLVQSVAGILGVRSAQSRAIAITSDAPLGHVCVRGTGICGA